MKKVNQPFFAASWLCKNVQLCLPRLYFTVLPDRSLPPFLISAVIGSLFPSFLDGCDLWLSRTCYGHIPSAKDSSPERKPSLVMKRWKSPAFYILERNTLNNSENSHMKPESTMPIHWAQFNFLFFSGGQYSATTVEVFPSRLKLSQVFQLPLKWTVLWLKLATVGWNS